MTHYEGTFRLPRMNAGGLPFDKLEAPSTAEEVEVHPESHLFTSTLKGGGWRGRTGQVSGRMEPVCR